MGIFHDHRAGNCLRVVNRLIQFFFGDVLNVLVDGEDHVGAGLRLLFDVGKPLPAGVDGDKHLSGTAAQLIVEGVLDAALAGVLHADGAHHLRR